MAPLKPVRKDTADKRVQSILDLADDALKALQDRALESVTLDAELEALTSRVRHLPASATLASRTSDFDNAGSALWNAATKLIRDHPKGVPEDEKASRLAVSLRVLGFLMIDTGYSRSPRQANGPDQQIRAFKIALKAARTCLDHSQVETALKVLERCAAHVNDAEEDSPIVRLAVQDGDSRESVSRRLVAEYYLLRLTHAWKSERLDLAEHFYSKVDTRSLASSAELAEKAADLLGETGRSLAVQQPASAIKWCERALGALDACSIEDLSQDAPDLRLSIAVSMVDALLTRKSDEDLARAMHVVDHLEEAHGLGRRIVVLFMRLKTLLAGHVVDLTQLSGTLLRMINTSWLTGQVFKTIMQSVHKAYKRSSDCALSALHHLIAARLIPDFTTRPEHDTNAQDQLERALVTLVVFATEQAGPKILEIITTLRDIMDTMVKLDGLVFSPRATHAAQALIWKVLSTSDPTISDHWCAVLQHPLFASAGHLNKARIGRKAMTNALARSDLVSARQAFYELPQPVQNELESRCLAFKIAVRSADHDFACESLQFIASSADKDPKFLYGCVLEAQQSAARPLAVLALQTLLDKQPPGVHLPSLLRCTARLLIGELGTEKPYRDEAVHEVIRTFEHAVSRIKAFNEGNEEQRRAEIRWWSKNSYNLALRLCADIHSQELVRLLAVCIKFLDQYPSDDFVTHKDDVRRRRMLCDFLAATALIVLARSEEEQAGKYYNQTRVHVAAFTKAYARIDDASEPKSSAGQALTKQEMSARIFEVLKFDLECILKLQKWDALDESLSAFLNFDNGGRWESLIDLVLILHTHTSSSKDIDATTASRITELLQKCINETWKKEKEIVKMSRWLRLTLSIHLSTDDTKFALMILEQAASIAQMGYDQQTARYPEDELQWMATTTFNKAVDLLAISDKAQADKWLDGALDMARWSADNGALHAHLTGKRALAEQRMSEGVM